MPRFSVVVTCYNTHPVVEQAVGAALATTGPEGVLVPHTEEGWYRGIRLLLDHPGLREEMARRAREFVLREYAAEKTAWDWLRLLQEVLAIKK